VTPTDNWYVCMDAPDDMLPDMFIGRMPGSSPEMLAKEIDKIVGFENATWPVPEKVLLVADNNEMSFENLNETLVQYPPTAFGVNRVYLRLYANVNDATQDIISSINHGVMVTNYVGHGSVTNWTGEYMFDSADIPLLTNSDRLTFVTGMTCLNGYFSQPFYYCLAEEFVAAQGKGAISSFAPSGLGYVWEHEILGTELFSILFDHRNSILGSLTTQAKIAAYARGVTQDMVKTFTLFGDPACRLKYAAFSNPTVTTTAVSAITTHGASSGGEVVSDGGADITARGVCWGQSADPTVSSSHTSDGTGSGHFASNITGLSRGATYHVRAYATNSAGKTGYGEDRSFTTLSTPPCPDCSGNAVVIKNVTFYAGTECECVGTTSITVGPGVTFEKGCRVTLKSRKISFHPDVHVERGAVIDTKSN